eukprot:1344779-Pleurochrysis_carterae.AAC.2
MGAAATEASPDRERSAVGRVGRQDDVASDVWTPIATAAAQGQRAALPQRAHVAEPHGDARARESGNQAQTQRSKTKLIHCEPAATKDSDAPPFEERYHVVVE